MRAAYNHLINWLFMFYWFECLAIYTNNDIFFCIRVAYAICGNSDCEHAVFWYSKRNTTFSDNNIN